MNSEEHRKNLKELISNLDITTTMQENAVQKYEGISKYLENQGINAQFYPQGSFRLGTVVKPYVEGEETDYDLDVICELLGYDKKKYTPQKVKQLIGDILKGSDRYKSLLLPEEDRCWTLIYAKVDEKTGFTLDIVPSISETPEYKEQLVSKRIPKELADPAIAITERRPDFYIWQSSNPKGYAKWFDAINHPFLEAAKKKTVLLAETRKAFQAEEIPNWPIRSSLQRVIQILKRHRDIFYTTIQKWDKRPISAIITTLVTQIARNASPESEIDELLQFILTELVIYKDLDNPKRTMFSSLNEGYGYMQKQDQKWKILNPVNPDDNYADAWTQEHANLFFRWITAAKEDLLESYKQSDERYFAALKQGFGIRFVEKTLPKSVPQKPIPTITQTKPWRSK
jgi:hypothetical protein